MNNLIITRPGRHEVLLNLNKEGEILEWFGVIEAKEAGEYELDLVLSHNVPNTFGRVIIKGVAGKGARVKVKGRVKILELAQETDSFLSMKILLLDKRSGATVEPELEIFANRVKASHSASVGKIDEEQLYYLKSRGINDKTARDIIIKGFLN